MRWRRIFLVGVTVVLNIMAARMVDAKSESSLEGLVDRYFDEYFHLNPSSGTAAGLHGVYDSALDDFSGAAFGKRMDLSNRFLPLFESLPASPDRDLMISHLHADLVNLHDIRQQETNPDIYSSGVTASIFGLISRKFASVDDRLKDVISRENQIPKVFTEAKKNLRNCPKIYTQVAIEQLPGIQSFFLHDVPAAFTDAKSQSSLAEFKRTNAAVVDALKQYQSWLETDLLPRSHGDFRIGAANFANKVKYEEMVDLPLERFLQIGYDNLHANQRALQQICKKIDPDKSTREVADQLSKDHPSPGELLQRFRDTFNGLISFIQQHKIITIPSETRPILEETPPFMRALTTASMDTPGPYEKVATEAYFNVTLPEKSWSPRQTEEFMNGFSRGTITSTAIHEAYPGHYVQLLWFQRLQSKVRKLIGANSNVEGWAHYTEQMMLDEGYGNGDPELRAGQLMDALLRNARYIVGIENAYR